VAQQGPPPGRHSRGPYPGDAPYGDEIPYRGDPHVEENPYRGEPDRDDIPHRDEIPRRDEMPYGGEPGRGDIRYRDDAPQSDRGGRPGRGARADRLRRQHPQRPRDAWQQLDPFGPGPDTDTDLPPWAGPGVTPVRPTGTLRRQTTQPRHDDIHDSAPVDDVDLDGAQPGVPAEGEIRSRRRRGRAAATRLRKSRRRVYRWGGVAIVICVVAAGIVAIVTHHTPKPVPYVTSLQHGEFTSVPNACGSVSTSVLNQFLPGSGRTSTSTISSTTNSQCTFTVDSKPNFLVLEVQAQSYQPFAAAGSDGSATGNAQDNFLLVQQGLAHPPKKSPLPPAQITKVTGLGQHAFVAFQNAHVSGIATDIVTVVIRERNVVITASLSGQESGHGFGPVPVSTLEAGAKAAAQGILAKVMTQPTA
jgi:hypothetical protein